jgi:hypothetical protein
MNAPSETWTIDELCKLWGYKRWLIYDFVKRGKLKPFKRKPLIFTEEERLRFEEIRRGARAFRQRSLLHASDLEHFKK